MSPKKRKIDEEGPQLSFFDTATPDASNQKVRELDQKITRSINLKDLARAKEAAQEQEKLLKNIIEQKKKPKP